MSALSHPSPNFEDRRGQAIRYIILHYTGMKTTGEALARLCDPARKVSAHYTIDEDGSLYSHVEEAKRAWHAGKSCWQDERDMNAASIGIEIVNPGHEHGYKKFPELQIQAVSKLCSEIMVRHDLPPESVLGHSDIAPARKQDPGELFPWKMLAEQGVGVWPCVSDEDVVKAAGMDVDRALIDFGYDMKVEATQRLVAFQRHYQPDAFETGRSGQIDGFTKAKLYALHARHWLIPKQGV